MKARHILFPAVLVCAIGVRSFAAENADLEKATTAAKKAVEYLSKSQAEDGTFGKAKASQMPGIVGLVIKALASSPAKLRETDPVVAKAVKYLIALQQPTGAIVDPKFGYENYNTSMAITALVSLENPAYKEVLEKAKKFILTCQRDDEAAGPMKGGFNYGTKSDPDLSNSGFSMEALNALGLEKDSPAWKNAVAFIKRIQDNDETNPLEAVHGGANSGGFFYHPSKSEFGYLEKNGKKIPKPYGNMSYMAIKSLIYAGMSKDEPVMQAAFKYIKNNYAVDHQPGGRGDEGYYFYVNVMAKALTAAGIKELELPDGKKANWAKDLSAHLATLQKPDGSFTNTAPRWLEADPILSTAYALDALNLCVEALKK